MAGLSDYLAWRGDILFEEVPLTVVDALLLSQLSYLDLRGIIGDGEKKSECTLAQASKRYWEIHTEKEMEQMVAVALRAAGNLVKEMARTKRFSGLVLRNYRNRIDVKEEEQFSAVEIVLGKKESFISFGGTDDTLIGWKEDLNMCFLSPIPAQTDAKEYLEQILSGSAKRIYVGGHSKGGNLSVYAAVQCQKRWQKNIVRVFNFDGPGFNRAFIDSSRYREMKERIETWVPESSVVGMLLEHEEDYQVVKSTQSGLWQHDATSWEVLGAGFIRLPAVKQSSRRLAAGVKEWMSGLAPAELEYFCDRMYEVLTASDAKTLTDLSKDRLKNITAILHSFNSMDKKAKEMLFALIKAMVMTGRRTELPKRTEPKPESKKKSKEVVVFAGRKHLPDSRH